MKTRQPWWSWLAGVDREFERLLSAVFGADFMSQFRRKRPAAYVELLLSFEARKRSAGPDRDAALTIFPPFAFVEAYRKFRGKEVSARAWVGSGRARVVPPKQPHFGMKRIGCLV